MGIENLSALEGKRIAVRIAPTLAILPYIRRIPARWTGWDPA